MVECDFTKKTGHEPPDARTVSLEAPQLGLREGLRAGPGGAGAAEGGGVAVEPGPAAPRSQVGGELYGAERGGGGVPGSGGVGAVPGRPESRSAAAPEPGLQPLPILAAAAVQTAAKEEEASPAARLLPAFLAAGCVGSPGTDGRMV